MKHSKLDCPTRKGSVTQGVTSVEWVFVSWQLYSYIVWSSQSLICRRSCASHPSRPGSPCVLRIAQVSWHWNASSMWFWKIKSLWQSAMNRLFNQHGKCACGDQNLEISETNGWYDSSSESNCHGFPRLMNPWNGNPNSNSTSKDAWLDMDLREEKRNTASDLTGSKSIDWFRFLHKQVIVLSHQQTRA